jgi:hypothetical protein
MAAISNTARNAEFCNPPACSQMNPTTTMPSPCTSASRRALPGVRGRPDDDSVANTTCTPPSASTPSEASERSMSKELSSHGITIASRIAAIASNQMSSSR